MTEAIKKIESLIQEIHDLNEYDRKSPEFKKWFRNTEVAIEKIFGKESRHITDFTSIEYIETWTEFNGNPHDIKVEYQKGLSVAKAMLESFIQELVEYGMEDKPLVSKSKNSDVYEIINNICNKFHNVAKQLQDRYDDRTTLTIEDEYDVQDLLHGLLRLHFDDIRPEEWTPSYAGSCSRVDFLLKRENIIIEVKKTRKSMSKKQLGEQLIIDKNRYRTHPNCDSLVCFVYDPEGRIGNARGLEDDLAEELDDFSVRVMIRPR